MKAIYALGSAMLAAAGLAHAQESVRTDAHRVGWYAVPMFSMLKADTNRLTDDGDGWMLAAGYRWDFASVELNGEYFTLDRNDGAGESKLRGGSVNALLHPFGSLRLVDNLHFLLGYGSHSRDNHPGFTKEDKTFFVDAGVGYQYPFHVFGWDFAARGEFRYRLDTQQPPFENNNTPREFEDWVYNLGLYLPLSRKPKPVPEAKPEPVAVVAAADTDADDDGVADTADQCPGTAPGAAVNDVGCVPEAGVVLTGVNFESNSDVLTTGGRAALDDIAKDLLSRPTERNEVGGHTDASGDDAYNQDLSQRRAESARAYLIEQGVNGDNLIAVGYGESQPLESNDTVAGRAKNRRVELKVLDGGAESAAAEPGEAEPATTEPAMAEPAAAEPSAESAPAEPDLSP